MADRQPIGGGSSRQGQSSEGPSEELLDWLALLAHTNRARTSDEAEGHRQLVRRRTSEDLDARRDDHDTLIDNQLRSTEEQLGLIEELDELQQTQTDHFNQYYRLIEDQRQAHTNIGNEQDASIAVMERIGEQQEVRDGYERQLDSLFDSLDEQWTEVGTTLNAQGIVVGDAVEARDPGRLRISIVQRRDALRQELGDLTRPTEQAQAEQLDARRRNEEATARLQALQHEIDALGVPSEDAEDEAVVARREALETERSEAEEAVESGAEELEQIGATLAGLEAQGKKLTQDIGALTNLVEGEDAIVDRLQSTDDEYRMALQSSLQANNLIEQLERELAGADGRIQEHEESLQDIRSQIVQNQLQISNVEKDIAANENRGDRIGQDVSELDRQKAALEPIIEDLLQTAERLDSDALIRAIQQLPASLQDDAAAVATPTPPPPITRPLDDRIAPRLEAMQAQDDTIAPEPRTTGTELLGAPPTQEEVQQAVEQLTITAGGDPAASASMLRATRDIGKVLLRDAALLTTFATVREAASYGIAASSDKTQQDLAALLIGLNFLPIVVKVGGLIYDTSASRPEADRMVPTKKQYASLVTNTLMMIGATAAAAQKGGGVAAQAPAAARALIIGLRDMANLFMPVTQNRRGDLLLNMRAVLGDNLAYSVYSQLTTILIAQGLVHSGAGTQAAGLVGREAAKEVAKYVGAYTAVELLETISYRAFNQYFDRIAQGLEPAMPGDPNAHQGMQGLKRYRAKVGFKLKHTFAEVRRQGTDAAHARQAFTYIVLLLGNVVAGLTKDLSVTNQTIALATTLFAATFAAYFPFVGLSEYATPPARDGAGNE